MISVNLLFDLLSIAITLLSIKLFLHKYIFLLLRKLIEPYVVKLSVAESKTNRKNELSLVNKAQHTPSPSPSSSIALCARLRLPLRAQLNNVRYQQ